MQKAKTKAITKAKAESLITSVKTLKNYRKVKEINQVTMKFKEKSHWI